MIRISVDITEASLQVSVDSSEIPSINGEVNETFQDQHEKPKIPVDSAIETSTFMNGEERARLVKERCEQYSELTTCLYPSRGVIKRMLPVVQKKFALCVMGKTGSSNWRTLILQMKGVITDQEARNMIYPHGKEYWVDKGTVYFYEGRERRQMIRTIRSDYYKVTFVRDPLSRLLSAYRDKFTGSSQEHSFKVYRTKRALEMCTCVEELRLVRPDGDLIPDEIYSYMSEEVKQHCNHGGGEQIVSLGIFFLILIFMPQDFKGDVLKELTVNTHFSDMMSMCDHCRINYDFIGTVETMDTDFEFLKKKLGIEYDLPQIASTQEGVMSKEEVQEMWLNLPELLKQYVYLYLSNDARAFGYSGYDAEMSKSLLPNHYERRTACGKQSF